MKKSFLYYQTQRDPCATKRDTRRLETIKCAGNIRLFWRAENPTGSTEEEVREQKGIGEGRSRFNGAPTRARRDDDRKQGSCFERTKPIGEVMNEKEGLATGRRQS